MADPTIQAVYYRHQQLGAYQATDIDDAIRFLIFEAGAKRVADIGVFVDGEPVRSLVLLSGGEHHPSEEEARDLRAIYTELG